MVADPTPPPISSANTLAAACPVRCPDMITSARVSPTRPVLVRELFAGPATATLTPQGLVPRYHISFLVQRVGLGCGGRGGGRTQSVVAVVI